MYYVFDDKNYENYKSGLSFYGEAKETWDEALNVVGQKAKERINPLYYMRVWTKNHVTTVDYGSHTKFFYIVEV